MIRIRSSGMDDQFNERTSSLFTVNPNTNLYHCLGDAVGVVISFIFKQENIVFRKAYKRLSTNCSNQPSANRSRTTAKKSCIIIYHLLLQSL